ncbi:hypothetical protein TNCV_3400271 [Trichonephila clavipes]|nr:hypothetical protein TNCV_3400271 [Trichonephila clavipes]
MPTSALKDLLKKWEAVRAMVLEWHPNQADVSRFLLQVHCGGIGSLVVKVTDSWLACHEFEPSVTENPPCRGMHIKSVEAQTSSRWCDEGIRRGGDRLCQFADLNPDITEDLSCKGADVR